MSLRGLSPDERRRLRYAADPDFRRERVNLSMRTMGKTPLQQPRKTVWTPRETASVLGISVWTLMGYRRLGIIPEPTYPMLVPRYWSYQVLLLAKLFERMRQEGWPRQRPHIVGSGSWTVYLNELQRKWTAGEHRE